MYKKLKNNEMLSHEIVKQIRILIQNKKLKSGDKIPNEIELAKLFGVSRPTIRESIKILVSNNTLEVARGRGTFVSENPGISNDPLGLDFITEDNLFISLVEARKIIEPSVAKFAAERATQKDIKNLEILIEQMKATLDNHSSWIVFDLDFHRSIAKATQNPVIMRIVPIIREAIVKTLRSASSNKYQHHEAFSEHIEILAAIQNKNPQEAYLAMEKHMENSNERFLNIFDNKKN